MAKWYSMIRGDVNEHNGKLWAISACNIHGAGGVPVSEMGVYRRDPRKHPDEPNILPVEIEKTREKLLAQQIRQMMRGRR